MSGLRREIDILLRPNEIRGWRDAAVQYGLIALILLNVVAVVLETVGDLYVRYKTEFDLFEWVSIAIFSLEYLARLWSCVEIPRYRHPVRGRLRYMVSFFALIDLLAILPSVLFFLVPADMRILRALRVLRVLRLLKIGRYSRSVSLLGRVVEAKLGELTVALMAVIVLLVISSSAMYYAEHAAQPEKFGSIPASMWWAVITLTTIGYGDVYPITDLGRVLGGVIGILGIGLFALPAGILASGLAEEIAYRRAGSGEGARLCPHCGRALDGHIDRPSA